MIYLGQPYSHPDKAVQEARYEAALAACAACFHRGIAVFSPIAHWHPVAKHHSLPTNAEPFELINHHMISLANQVLVLGLDGWEKSAGLREEVFVAHKLFKPLFFALPSDLLKAEYYLSNHRLNPQRFLERFTCGKDNKE